MNKQLENIIKKIDSKIAILNEYEEYKPEERKILEKISKNNSFINFISDSRFLPTDLLISAVIVKGEYKDIKEISYMFEKHKDNINGYWMGFLKLLENESILCLPENKLIKYLKGNVTITDKNRKRRRFNLDEIQSFICFIKLYKISDEEIFYVINDIINLAIDRFGFYSELGDLRKYINIQKGFKNFVNEEYDIDNISKQLKRISDLYQFMEVENKRIARKKIKERNDLLELKKILLLVQNNEEITDIDKIFNLSPEYLKSEILLYIANHNIILYNRLEKRYNYLKENSYSNYLMVFSRRGINFKHYSQEQQNILMKLSLRFIEKVFEFLDKIGYDINDNVASIICSTNDSILDNIEEYVRKGILTYTFVRRNIQIILSRKLTNENAFYEGLIANIQLFLTNGINIIELDEDSLDIFLSDITTINNNFYILKKLGISINTKTLRDYRFLSKNNLQKFIEMFKVEGVDINNNLYLLNCDENVIKRIKICKSIGVDIYIDGKIRNEVMNEKFFFIPDYKLDNYIENKEFTLKP